ncbi:Protein SABRE [Vitis vinifera]|uniref:Protein SABRE n=1 Tax=Vitis vinifera TaxID=29760 RepID=A0A438G077_VITVI|nr:Protein SABRE [Vitis vinifera]
MVLQEGAANPDKVHSTDFKAIMWTCTVSAPEMTTVLYSLSGIPLYHDSMLNLGSAIVVSKSLHKSLNLFLIR